MLPEAEAPVPDAAAAEPAPDAPDAPVVVADEPGAAAPAAVPDAAVAAHEPEAAAPDAVADAAVALAPPAPPPAPAQAAAAIPQWFVMPAWSHCPPGSPRRGGWLRLALRALSSTAAKVWLGTRIREPARCLRRTPGEGSGVTRQWPARFTTRGAPCRPPSRRPRARARRRRQISFMPAVLRVSASANEPPLANSIHARRPRGNFSANALTSTRSTKTCRRQCHS